MRLSAFEQHMIQSILKPTDGSGNLYLFGSRVDDHKRGGDIDLFFEPSTHLALRDQLSLQYKLSHACQTKVDLLIKNPHQANSSFFDLARQGISL